MNAKQRQEAIWENVFAQARIAGALAGRAANPNPMLVQIDGGKIYEVPGGPCGFAWVTVRPGNSPVANWLKKRFTVEDGTAWKPAYGGGIQLWVWDFDQSMVRKAAYARAYAETLKANGIAAVAGSRMD